MQSLNELRPQIFFSLKVEYFDIKEHVMSNSVLKLKLVSIILCLFLVESLNKVYHFTDIKIKTFKKSLDYVRYGTSLSKSISSFTSMASILATFTYYYNYYY